MYNINIISLSNTVAIRFDDEEENSDSSINKRGEPIQGEIEFLWWISEDISPPGGAEWIMETEINFFVSDDSNVPPSKRHNLHRACLASRDWIFPHLRRSHAQDLAVSKCNDDKKTLFNSERGVIRSEFAF